jgi:hypothetical protein
MWRSTPIAVPPENSSFIDPLILYDLDDDGLSEIILPAKNLVYRRHSQDRYQSEPLCRYPPGLIFTALIADVDGDGAADLLCANSDGLVLLKGSPQGAFEAPGRLVWAANPRFVNPMVRPGRYRRGDLDLFLGNTGSHTWQTLKSFMTLTMPPPICS